MTELNFTNSEALSAEFMGLKEYEAVVAKQLELVGAIRGTRKIHVLGLEFKPVITLGVRGRAEEDLAGVDNSIPVIQTDRGGQATMHTPGQLVVYPMMDLKTYGIGVRDFVCVISKATSATLKHYGIESFSSDEAPGLYTVRGKIAFIGIRLDRGVVRHGLSLNVSNDLAHFSAIRSCGVSSAAIDRVKNYETTLSLDLNSVFQKWMIEFQRELDLVQRANPEICSLQSAKDPLKIIANH
ncbi:MAG: lipoyl(octanoyl) transferase LipB [Bdellovibrionaceae bacterium]|nr:lipoyl(octanoyl) transferase LipB [Pseudobdellovibrionaceae bacterium]